MLRPCQLDIKHFHIYTYYSYTEFVNSLSHSDESQIYTTKIFTIKIDCFFLCETSKLIMILTKLVLIRQGWCPTLTTYEGRVSGIKRHHFIYRYLLGTRHDCFIEIYY